MARILIVEDERKMGELMLLLIEGMGHDVMLANSGAAGLELLAMYNHEVVLADIHMEPMNGLEFIGRVKERHPRSVFVFVSGDDHPDLLAQGLRLGALEFLHKPVRVDELKTVLRRALNRVERERVAQERASKEPATPAPAAAGLALEQIVTELESYLPGKAFGLIRKQLAQLLTTSRHALIETPSGTINPALLHAMHRMSAFSTKPLVVRNAAEDAVASVEELMAPLEHGLLVLLNLEAIPIKLQQALTTHLRDADKMRVIATTREDPDRLMIEGRLAGALYSRLVLCALRLPSLGELEAKIPEILVAALQKTPAYPFGKTAIEIDATAAKALRTYSWPEELTELWSVANLLATHLKEPRLTLALLPERISGARLPRLEQYLRKAEAQHVQRALCILESVPQAAEAMGVSTAELEAFQKSTHRESLFILKHDVPAPVPPPPVVERVLLVAGDEIIRHAANAALTAKGVAVTAVADGLAAIAAVVLARQPFAAAVLVHPMALLEAGELGAQLARLAPHMRLGLLGERASPSGVSPFHVVVPPFKTCEDLEGILGELLHPVVQCSAA